MAETVTRWQKIKMYLQLPLVIPGLFRKYDAPQALRISARLFRSFLEALFGTRALRWIGRFTRMLWYATGPALISYAINFAVSLPRISYRDLWYVFALILIGLTLSLDSLGRLTLNANARAVFRPLGTLPTRVLLLGALWAPVSFELSFQSSLIFAGCAISLFLLVGPHLSHWRELWLFQLGSPRKASLAQAMTMPVMNEASIDRFAAHEAGHALMFGLGSDIPEDLYLYIDPEAMDGHGGAVLMVEEFTPDRATVEHLRFRLMVLAAGAAGEQVHTGAMSLASHHDFVSFEVIAVPYMLAAGYAVHGDPKSEEQHTANATAVARLRTEMVALAQRVIEANREVHHELIDKLKGNRELAYDDVLPTLAKVRVVADAPVPTWPATLAKHALRP